jgi:carbon monoxide dehydrogenase subunit G
MNITGSHVIDALRPDVWKALHDPAVLARTLPGCQALEVIGPDRYAATVTAGVASIKGTYRGEVELVDKHEPEHTTLRISGAGAPGTVEADATVHLHEDGDGATRIEYAATAVIGGTVGGVGQRVLSGVAQRTAKDFFDALERDLHGEVPVAPERAVAGAEAPAAAPTGTGAGAEVGTVFPGAAGRPAGDEDRRRAELVGAMVLGALIALVGVLVGRRLVR